MFRTPVPGYPPISKIGYSSRFLRLNRTARDWVSRSVGLSPRNTAARSDATATPKIIDICAGIGILSFCKFHFQHHEPERLPAITCVEINPDYVRVGRKLLPEAEWICADIFDVWQDLPRDFTTAIANPPFGNIRHAGKAPRYSGPEFEYKIIDIAGHLATYGASRASAQAAAELLGLA